MDLLEAAVRISFTFANYPKTNRTFSEKLERLFLTTDPIPHGSWSEFRVVRMLILSIG